MLLTSHVAPTELALIYWRKPYKHVAPNGALGGFSTEPAYPKLFPMRSRLVCDSCRPEVRPDLFEAQRAMPRVVEPEYELLVGGASDFGR